MFDGKVCYITGATSGLGKASAIASAAEGCKTVLTGRRAEKGEAIVAEIKAAGGEAHYIKCDVTDHEQVKASIDETVEKYGSLDYAFNNAGGAAADDWGPPHKLSPEGFAFTTSLNMNGVFSSIK